MQAFSTALLNQKGGVGKTSTCHHLAGTFSKAGRRVLLIDADPQASLTQGFWGPDAMRALRRQETIAALFDDGIPPPPDEIIRSTDFPGIDLLPGSEFLNSHNLPDPEDDPRQVVLRDLVEEVRDRYDIVLIDCPPNLCLCSWSALVAGDGVVVPLQAEDYGAQGISAIQRAVARAHREANPRLVLLGYLITMYNQTLAIHRAYADQLRSLYGDQVFGTMVPLAKDFKEAVSSRLPISHYKPKGAPAKAMVALAEELLARASEAVSNSRRVA
jgi:chromosome partitioning protein